MSRRSTASINPLTIATFSAAINYSVGPTAFSASSGHHVGFRAWDLPCPTRPDRAALLDLGADDPAASSSGLDTDDAVAACPASLKSSMTSRTISTFSCDIARAVSRLSDKTGCESETFDIRRPVSIRDLG
jgi:hypothetical protein